MLLFAARNHTTFSVCLFSACVIRLAASRWRRFNPVHMVLNYRYVVANSPLLTPPPPALPRPPPISYGAQKIKNHQPVLCRFLLFHYSLLSHLSCITLFFSHCVRLNFFVSSLLLSCPHFQTVSSSYLLLFCFSRAIFSALYSIPLYFP